MRKTVNDSKASIKDVLNAWKKEKKKGLGVFPEILVCLIIIGFAFSLWLMR